MGSCDIQRVLNDTAMGFLGAPASAETDATCTQYCAELPSSRAAADFLDGRAGGIVSVVGSTLVRGALITTGIYLAQGKQRDLGQAFKLGSAGAVAIEVFVLGYTWWRKSSQGK